MSCRGLPLHASINRMPADSNLITPKKHHFKDIIPSIKALKMPICGHAEEKERDGKLPRLNELS